MCDVLQGSITSMEGMKAVMRKCDYLHDPLSHQQCTPYTLVPEPPCLLSPVPQQQSTVLAFLCFYSGGTKR